MDVWIARLNAFLRKRGLRHSIPREIVAEELFKSADHIGIEALYRRVQKVNPDIGIATVYRTLNLLVEGGLALRR